MIAVLERRPSNLHDGGDVILCYNSQDRHTPFVTWIEFRSGDRFDRFWGEYFTNKTDAQWSFDHRDESATMQEAAAGRRRRFLDVVRSVANGA